MIGPGRVPSSVSKFMVDERILAVGLLTKSDLEALGTSFTRAWPVEEASCFSELLDAIDQAERELREPASSADAQDH